ncbi:gliding motility-associated lipoprotein GldD [Sinomicrobium oceani]|uniref:Gliding motility-associated lipoprotein GldD n=1 Tax=Sinomicrobium oceani TaxID=1150368 RepID=A0A1K1MY10_9FLAO|nr:gliding motility lipoprotein GldD [Sinomicrobium oceani]SFW28084.1 gliding motility-associated lipoprotein GldD [Sinomicrobium oceani]
MKKNVILYCSVLSILLTTACGEETIPKPKAVLRLDYPSASYQATETGGPFRFEKNTRAVIKPKGDGRLNIEYPDMKATVYLTYMPVRDNLKSLLRDAEKLTYDHVVKADEIGVGGQFENNIHHVYGRLYEVTGNAASQTQFYITDSTSHFITGSLYFYTKPNYDSILPAAAYLNKDIRRLMETLRWE